MEANDDTISVRVISDTKGILQIEREWNALVFNSGSNPFLLSEFAKEFMEHIPRVWNPVILTISNNNTLIGIVPLKTRRNRLGLHVDFLYPQWCSEFIFDEQHRKECISHTFDFLFKTLNCKFASFALPDNSSHLLLLKQQCTLRKIHLETFPEMGHRIIPIDSTWNEFKKSRTGKFLKKIRRMERNLNKAGLWTAICTEGNKQSDIVEKILNIEENSWKEKGRTQKGESDWLLTLILRAAQQLTKIEPRFKWNVWFLELNGRRISYLLSIEYKEVAYLAKTSYCEQYKGLYPGIAIQNASIQELFNKRQNKYIDLLLDLPYHQNWTDKCLSRTKFDLTKGTMPNIAQLFYRNKFVSRILSAIIG